MSYPPALPRVSLPFPSYSVASPNPPEIYSEEIPLPLSDPTNFPSTTPSHSMFHRSFSAQQSRIQRSNNAHISALESCVFSTSASQPKKEDPPSTSQQRHIRASP